jgi:hypothetical protein
MGDEIMKALSIRQPWAWAIMECGKRVENRTWRTKYRGPILLHASKGFTKHEWRQFYNDAFDPSISICKPIMDARLRHDVIIPDRWAFTTGAIIGVAELVDVVTESDSPWFFGPYGFVLDNVQPIEPVPMLGMLGLFNVPDHFVHASQQSACSTSPTISCMRRNRWRLPDGPARD